MLVAWLTAVTVRPGTAPPDSSDTMPVTVARPVWAAAVVLRRSPASAMKLNRGTKFADARIGDSLVGIPGDGTADLYPKISEESRHPHRDDRSPGLFRQNFNFDERRCSRVDYRQLEELLERVEVSVVMKQRVLAKQAECSNKAVDSFADRVTAAPKRPIVSRRLACQLHAPGIQHLQRQQFPLNLLRHNVVADALQH